MTVKFYKLDKMNHFLEITKIDSKGKNHNNYRLYTFFVWKFTKSDLCKKSTEGWVTDDGNPPKIFTHPSYEQRSKTYDKY